MRKWSVIIAVLFSGSAFASDCTPTPRITTYPYPGVKNIPYTNHLAKPAGKAQEAYGQPLVVRGRVLDARCRPVKDAIVELWQADPFGKFALATGADMVSANATFTGAGRTFTREDGGFVFHTLFPGAARGRAPNVNIRVDIYGLKRPLQTQLFFGNESRNAKDSGLRWVRPAVRGLLTMNMQALNIANHSDGAIAEIDLVLDQNIGYLTY